MGDLGMRGIRGRRSLLAGTAALMGAAIAKLGTADRAEATHTAGGTANSDSNALHANASNGNFVVGDTEIHMNGDTLTPVTSRNSFRALAILASGGRLGLCGAIRHFNVSNVSLALPGLTEIAGVLGVSLGPSTGVRGESTEGVGVFGISRAEPVSGSSDTTNPFKSSPPSGAVGVAGLADTGIGVRGEAPGGVGVQGVTTSGVAVQGQSETGVGMRGVSNGSVGVLGTSGTAFGVQGLSTNAYGVSGNSDTQAGVWGSSNSNTGVLGSSLSGVGVSGVSTSSNGVNGLSTSGIGVYGSSPNGLAGRFDGNVVVVGNLTVTGSFPHTAAVPSSDGTLRRLYSLETAEAFYEDVGQGSLTNGVGAVSLDPDFAALIRTDAYQVFLTAYGDNRGLFVSTQSATGFEVREVQGGTSGVGFGYRVLARPRSAASPRLDRITVPAAPAQPRLDRVEPVDVPATLRDLHQLDKPSERQPGGPAPRTQDGR